MRSFQPDGWILRQPVRSAVRHVGCAGSAPVRREAAKISWAGVLFTERHSSVSVGLGILVAFSRGLQMNEQFFLDRAMAHFVLISAFTFSNVSTGLTRISADIGKRRLQPQGHRHWYRLRHVTLYRFMAPWMISALALSLSLSMGAGRDGNDLSAGLDDALPVIFSLTDRGNVPMVRRLTIVLVGITLLLMIKLERTPPDEPEVIITSGDGFTVAR